MSTPKLTPIMENRMAKRAEHERSIYFARIPAGVTLDALMKDRTYWRHCVSRLKAGKTLIELVADDGSFDALARVVDCGVGFAALRLLYAYENKDVKAEPEEVDTGSKIEPFTLKHIPRGSTPGWRVYGVDGEIVEQGIKEKTKAEFILNEYKQRVGV